MIDLDPEPLEDESDPEEPTPEPDHYGTNGGSLLDWRDRLITRTKKVAGKDVELVIPNASNIATILRYHAKWRGVIAYDAFNEAVVTMTPAPWHPIDAPSEVKAGIWTDVNTGRAVSWLAREERFETRPAILEQALAVVAHANVVHPVRDYLRALKWDGVQRLPSLLSVYFGAEQTDYTAEIGKRWMTAAVARIMRPGCQVDCTIILEGKQGRGKSSAIRALAGPDWYSETGITIGDKDSYQCLRGKWIFLFDELDSFKRGELTKMKNFLTSPKDSYRPSYGRRTQDFLRQVVFAGTTNEEEYLIDRTGNRRFWPVMCLCDPDIAAIVRDRDQLWAEARSRFESGEPWHVDTPELRRLCEAEQEQRLQHDDWEPLFAKWLKNPEHNPAEGVLTVDVLVGALGKSKDEITRADTMRCADCLRALGYERGPEHREDGARVRRYLKGGDEVGTEGGDT